MIFWEKLRKEYKRVIKEILKERRKLSFLRVRV